MNERPSPSYKSLRQRWEDEEMYPSMKSVWPETRYYSLKNTARLFGKDKEKAQIEERLSLLEKNCSVPVPALIGVIGGKNAGKSSWVSGFLSEPGRKRILTGERFKEGTQRFVFWLPQDLENEASFVTFFHNLLASLFDEKAEILPEDPEHAHEAYTRRNCMHKPIIAYDSQLNGLGLAFLDTPDFQTAMDTGLKQPTSHIRLQWIERVSKLLQCVIFIVSRSDVGNEIFSVPEGYLQQEMRSLPRFLCLNKMRRPEPEVMKDEDVLAANERFQPENTYGAYDFAIRHSEDWIPGDEHSLDMTRKEVPVFFSLEEEMNRAESPPTPTTLRDSLMALDGSALATHYHKKLVEQASEEIENLEKKLLDSQILHKEKFQLRHEELLNQLEEMWPKDNDRNILRPESMRMIQESLERTAPFYAKPTLWMKNKLDSVKNTLSTFADRVKKPFGQTGSTVANRTSDPTISVFDLESMIRHSYNTKPTLGLPQHRLREAWTAVFQTIDKADLELDTKRIDEGTNMLWKDVSLWKKLRLGLAAPAVLSVSLAACLALPIISLGSPVLLQLSLGELLLVLLGTGGLSQKTGYKMFHSAIHEMENRERDIFYRAAYQVFGLPHTLSLKKGLATSPEQTSHMGKNIEWPSPVVCLVEPAILPE